MSTATASRATLARAAASEWAGDPSAVAAGRLVRFHVGGQPYALPLDRVSEVVALGSATATAPRGWVGTLARNQRPVPIGDLAYLLGSGGQAVARRDMRAVMLRGKPERGEVGAALFGVTVESVPAVIDVGAAEAEALPTYAQRNASPIVRASLIRDEELLLILDPDVIGERLAVGVVRGADGRVSELRALPRRPNGDYHPAPAGRSVAPDPPRRDTPVLLLRSVETADGDGGLVPAMPMGWVQEVRAMQAVRPLPHAPAGLSGVIAWRGRCLPVIDLIQRLTGIPSTGSASQRMLIVGPQGGPALGGMIVPGVRGLATIEGSPSGKPPVLPDTIDPGLLQAWTRHGDDAVAILDPTTLFS